MANSSSDDEETLYGYEDAARESGISIRHRGGGEPMSRLAPSPLPAAILLPLYLRQPSRWAREQVETCANSDIKRARLCLLFDDDEEEEGKRPIAERQQAYRDYLILIGNNEKNHNLHSATSTAASALFAWEKTLPMDSLDHERLFCLHNLASLTMRRAAQESNSNNTKVARQLYQEASLLWRLVGEQAALVPVAEGHPREARTQHALQWTAIAHALAQHTRALEVHVLDASYFPDVGTHRFMVGQAMALSRECWRVAKEKVKADMASSSSSSSSSYNTIGSSSENPLALPTALLSHLVSAQHYAQWARFHGVPEEEGGREQAACEYTVTAAICLLDRALARFAQVDKLRKQDNSRLEKKLHNLSATLLNGGRAPENTNAALKQWLCGERNVIEEALAERRETNRNITMQPSLGYGEVALEKLMLSRDHDDDNGEEKEAIVEMRDQLTLPDPWTREETLESMRKQLALTLHENVSREEGEEVHPDERPKAQVHEQQHELQQHMDRELLQIQRVRETLTQTKKLWEYVRGNMARPYNSHISSLLQTSEHLLATQTSPTMPLLHALERALADEVQPFCRIFLNNA